MIKPLFLAALAAFSLPVSPQETPQVMLNASAKAYCEAGGGCRLISEQDLKNAFEQAKKSCLKSEI